MKKDIILKKMYVEGRDFITSGDIERYCTSMKLNYDSMIRYLLSRKYLIRIFKGIFYLRTPEEVSLGRDKYSYLELVARGLEMKGVKKWYFALSTALKLNNMTHEHFATDYVINDRIYSAKPVKIAGREFRFVKTKPMLLGFGITGDKIRHSDPEKTLLDLIYFRRYNGVPEDKIIMDVSEYSDSASRKKLAAYAKNYPKPVRAISEKVMK